MRAINLRGLPPVRDHVHRSDALRAHRAELVARARAETLHAWQAGAPDIMTASGVPDPPNLIDEIAMAHATHFACILMGKTGADDDDSGD